MINEQIQHFPRAHYEPEVNEFASAMIDELKMNEHKGIWSQWSPTLTDVTMDLNWHVSKLADALSREDKSRVRELSADIGNIAMKAFHTFGK